MRDKTSGALLLLSLLVVVAFWNAPPEEFSFDSRGLILESSCFAPETSWWRPFSTNYWAEMGYSGLYRPLALTALRIEHDLLGFGAQPGKYAGVNIGLHLLASFLVLLLARRWLSSKRAGLVAAVLFAIHPMASAVVPTATGQIDILAAGLVLGCLASWERYRETGAGRWLTTAALLWLLGLLCKESAIVAPGLIVVLELARSGRADGSREQASLRPPLRATLPFTAAGGLWFLVRQAALEDQGERFILALNNSLVLEPWVTRFLTGSRVMLDYLGQALLPVSQSADYSFDAVAIVQPALEPSTLVTLALGLGVLWLTWVLWRRQRPAAIGLAFFFVALMPVSNIFFLAGSIRADRFLYLPLVGVCLFAAELLTAAATRFVGEAPRAVHPRAWVVAAAVALVGFGMVATRRENAAWRTNLSVWERAVVATPGNLKAHYNLAFFLNKDSPGSADRALEHLKRAVAIENQLPGDDHNAAHINLGKAYLKRAVTALGPDGDLNAQSVGWLERSLRVLEEAERRQSFAGRRRAWWERLNSDEVASSRRLAAGNDRFGETEIHTTMASVLDLLGQSTRAIEQAGKAVAIDPLDGRLRFRLATLHLVAGDLVAAEPELTAATTLTPENKDAWFRLAAVRLNNGDFRQGIDALSNGKRHHPASPEFDQTLQKVYPAAVDFLRRNGRADEAEDLIRLAIDRDGLPRALFGTRAGGAT